MMKNFTSKQKRALDIIKDVVKNEKNINGMWIVGSLARDDFDSLSDIDLYLLVDKLKFDKIYEKRRKFAEQVGPILTTFEVDWGNCKLYGVIYKNCLEVDYCYVTLENLEIFDRFLIEIDKTGKLEEILENKRVLDQTEFENLIKKELEFIPYNLLNLIKQLARNNLWSANHHLEILRNTIIKIIYMLNFKHPDEELSNFEDVLDEELTEKLKLTFNTLNRENMKSNVKNMINLLLIITDLLPLNLGIIIKESILTLDLYFDNLML